jgi:hypothetical protein
MQTSENSVSAKFAEFLFYEVGCIEPICGLAVL